MLQSRHRRRRHHSSLIEAADPYLEKGDLQQLLSSTWIDDDSNAPYLAAAKAVAARGGDNQLALLRPKQRAACLILERMDESVARASNQSRASLAVLLKASHCSLVKHSLQSRPPFTPSFWKDIVTRLTPDLGTNKVLTYLLLDPLLPLSTIPLAGQDLLHACLSIDPVNGALELEGLCEMGTKLQLHLNSMIGKVLWSRMRLGVWKGGEAGGAVQAGRQ